jgi:hypothetical protein
VARPDDIAAYDYKADRYCAACAVQHMKNTLSAAEWERYRQSDWPVTDEADLDVMAEIRGIDREDESTFDSDDFPKVVFRDMLQEDDRCGSCYARLG